MTHITNRAGSSSVVRSVTGEDEPVAVVTLASGTSTASGAATTGVFSPVGVGTALLAAFLPFLLSTLVHASASPVVESTGAAGAAAAAFFAAFFFAAFFSAPVRPAFPTH